MKTIYIILIAFIIFSCEKNTSDSKLPDIPKDLLLSLQAENIISADNSFAFDLFKHVIDNTTTDNQFISPTSVALALAMTYNGAEGETKIAMENAMRKHGLTTKDINEGYKDLIEALCSADPRVVMEIANSIWYRNDFNVLNDFIDVNNQYYNALVTPLDFSSDNAPDEINSWVSEKTHNKIKKIINSINDADVMFLINAVYFKGLWTSKFDKSNTYDGTFYLNNENEITAPFMKQTGNFKCMSTDEFTMVELPYGRRNFSMMILLPDDSKLENIENAFNNENWDSWCSKLDSQTIDLTIPSFTFEYENKLNDELEGLGMGIAFTDNADFSGINGSGGLNISEVKHKSFVKVDEEGTEAAAVTSVGIELTSIPQNIVFRADHPFIFVIRENTTGAIVFMGRVQNPLSEKNEDSE